MTTPPSPTAETEPKPCPFCGEPGFLFEIRSTFGVRCGRCQMNPQTARHDKKEKAIDRWNRRATDPELERLREEVRVCEKALRRIIKHVDGDIIANHGHSLNGSWCVEQARVTLAAIAQIKEGK